MIDKAGVIFADCPVGKGVFAWCVVVHCKPMRDAVEQKQIVKILFLLNCPIEADSRNDRSECVFFVSQHDLVAFECNAD